MSYTRLWDVEDHTNEYTKIMLQLKAQEWPGLPKPAISSNPSFPKGIPENLKYKYKPTPSLVGRKIQRRGGYMSLANYNSIP